MDGLKPEDWDFLDRIDEGLIRVAAGNGSVDKLLRLQFIVKRPGDAVAITGLGRDALLRRKYNFSLPLGGDDDEAAPGVRRPAADDESSLPWKGTPPGVPVPRPPRRPSPADIS